MRHRIIITMLVLTGLISALGPARAIASPPDALSSASYGRSSIWLERDPADRAKRRLVFQDAGTPGRVLAITVPERNRHVVSAWAENVALGLDGNGRLAVVLQGRRGLYWSPVARPRLRRVPGTTGDDVFPSIFRGRLAFTHAAGKRTSLRSGTLTTRTQRTLATANEDDNAFIMDTRIGAAGAVAYVIGGDGAEAAFYHARLARPGRATLNVWPGDSHNDGITLQTDRSGRKLTVAADGRALRYALPSGRRLDYARQSPSWAKWSPPPLRSNPPSFPHNRT
jgi:hypothetical protein